MATLKHIASKNSDYTAIEAYLIYQHDEFTGKQLLDEQGKPKLRESYLLDTLECGDFSFATACLLANRKYGKNTQHGDIKSHQYIISFDPRDAADNGLTMEKAQALGLKFCEENFSGHPAIVCTHPDGHNHSGNIHVHIVIGSVRTREVERKPYMQKPRDWREGMKHSSTAQTMRHLRVEVMELCEGAELYQIDLLNGSKERVSEAEYWVRRRGQLKLDRENASLTVVGQQPKQKKFETVKDTLRKQISSVLYRATSFEDFSDKLIQQYGIAVKESRGQLSYLPAGRTKFIRAKKLGDKFDKAAVLATLQANAERKPKVQSKPTNLAKLIDIQSRMTEGKGIGYKRWLTKHNLKVMAQTVNLLQEKGLTDEDALNQRITELETKYHDALAVVKDLEGRMKANKELRYHVAAYASTKSVAQQLKTAKRPAAFEEQHRAELTAYRAAAAYLKANNITSLSSPNKLEAEYCALASEKAQFYEQYREAKSELLKLKDAKQNVALFFREEKQTQHHEREGVCV
ncbi:relaxase [Faecalibacterium prausnitzii]|uniref:relaxase/mobilization nuclease domain-containing protein n=1 Tax=Faecalibacterium prausnitzii TaxID=853 RepID=UPI000BED10E0|nr:relaxase/mobilization nuclease domain-containing protein [Faecalibacterium prausnitzii]PDX70421.1 relaxase [Faecalibacterium prausnitzii]